jgi:hypothetical protein
MAVSRDTRSRGYRRNHERSSWVALMGAQLDAHLPLITPAGAYIGVQYANALKGQSDFSSGGTAPRRSFFTPHSDTLKGTTSPKC